MLEISSLSQSFQRLFVFHEIRVRRPTRENAGVQLLPLNFFPACGNRGRAAFSSELCGPVLEDTWLRAHVGAELHRIAPDTLVRPSAGPHIISFALRRLCASSSSLLNAFAFPSFCFQSKEEPSRSTIPEQTQSRHRGVGGQDLRDRRVDTTNVRTDGLASLARRGG